jgi:hypothetical protein
LCGVSHKTAAHVMYINFYLLSTVRLLQAGK